MYGVNTNFYYFMQQRQSMHRSRKRRRRLTVDRLRKDLPLLDSQEYVVDPSGYFLRMEHWSLDGG